MHPRPYTTPVCLVFLTKYAAARSTLRPIRRRRRPAIAPDDWRSFSKKCCESLSGCCGKRERERERERCSRPCGDMWLHKPLFFIWRRRRDTFLLQVAHISICNTLHKNAGCWEKEDWECVCVLVGSGVKFEARRGDTPFYGLNVFLRLTHRPFGDRLVCRNTNFNLSWLFTLFASYMKGFCVFWQSVFQSA